LSLFFSPLFTYLAQPTAGHRSVSFTHPVLAIVLIPL
jgi:hypothetical protein